MEKYASYLIVSGAVALFIGALIISFFLYSKWNTSAMRAYSDRADIERTGIGGFLWFPAIWTVTDFLTGAAVAGQALAVGLILILLAIPNAILFWSRNWIYPHFFLAKSVLGLSILISIYGPSAVGYGFAFAIIASAYLYLSKRSKKTFIHRLNGSIRT